MSNPSLILPQSPAYGEDYVYAAQVEDGAVPLYNVLPLTFTRASGGTRINKDGLVQNMPYNLTDYSEDFSNGFWTKSNTTITTNATTAPNGTTTADKVISSAVNDEHLVYYFASQYFNQVVTLSAYVKKSDYRYAILRSYTNSSYRISVFDLDNGVIASQDLGTSTIQSVGNGWYRISTTFTTPGSTFSYQYAFSATQTFVYAGDGTSGNFLWGAQVNIGSTAQPYLATTDRLNMPRITYPVGGGCGALLLEKQSTNLALQSQSFASPWSITNYLGTNPVVTQNYGISPDGTQNATRIQLARTNSNDSYSQIFQYPISVTSGQQYTWSVWLKALSGTPTISIIGDFGRPSVTLTSEWVRYTGTGTASSSLTQLEIAILGSTYASGNSLSADFLAWGYQFEQSSYATSYIPTTSTSATRIADACYKTGISNLIGQTSGTILWDLQVDQLLSSENILNIDNGSFGNTIYFLKSTSGGITTEVYASASLQCSFSYSLPSVGRYKIALAYANNDFALYVNGVSRGTDTSGSVPATSRLQMGNGALGSSDGKVNELVLYTTRLTNAELANLTTL